MTPPRTFEEARVGLWQRLLRKSELGPGECRSWTGYVNANGYGYVSVPIVLREHLGNRTVTAPRAMTWIIHGPPEPGQQVLHSCHRRLCIEPEHLRWGTQLENNHQAWTEGAQRWGEQHPQAKLTDAEMAEVMARARAGERVYELADEYGISWSSIYGWLRGENRQSTSLRAGKVSSGSREETE